jgi:hypothetical protein
MPTNNEDQVTPRLMQVSTAEAKRLRTSTENPRRYTKG